MADSTDLFWRALLLARQAASGGERDSRKSTIFSVNGFGRLAPDEAVSTAEYPNDARTRSIGGDELDILVAYQASEFDVADEQEDRTGHAMQRPLDVEVFVRAAVDHQLGRAWIDR
jgi:hypothetical protein